MKLYNSLKSRSLSIIILSILVLSTFLVIPAGGDWGDPIPLDPIVSSAGDSFKYGSILVDEFGYPQPPAGDWQEAVSAWRHPTWKRVSGIDSLYDVGADWIWRVEKISSIEQATGSIVFFTEEIEVSGWLSEAVRRFCECFWLVALIPMGKVI